MNVLCFGYVFMYFRLLSKRLSDGENPNSISIYIMFSVCLCVSLCQVKGQGSNVKGQLGV